MKKTLKTLKMTFSFFNKRQKKSLAGVFLLQVILALLETGTMTIAFAFMSIVMQPDEIMEISWMKFIFDLFDFQNTNQLLVLVSSCIALSYLVKCVFSIFASSVEQNFVRSSHVEMSVAAFERTLKQKYSKIVRIPQAEIIRTIATDVGIVFALVGNIITFFSEMIIAASLIVFMIVVDAQITLILSVLLGVLLMVSNSLVIKQIRTSGKTTRTANVKMTKWIYQTLGGIKNIYVNKRQQHFVNEYTKASDAWAKASTKLRILGKIPTILIESVSMAGVFMLVAVVVALGTNLQTLLPVLGTFALVSYKLLPSVKKISNTYTAINESHPSIKAVYDSVKQQPADTIINTDHKADDSKETDFTRIEKGIVVENLTFRFDGEKDHLFSNANLTIPANKSIAFVGKTGAGKTTMADIILGLQIPQEGSVTADGHDVFKSSTGWSRLVGYIPQEIYLCDDTIRNNVSFGYSSNDIDDKHIWVCLENAQVADFVKSLPDQLDTIVGEKGARLSGGQKQRIGIARALFSNPQFLVMDEATSSLDGETERAVMQTISELAGKVTILIIAHRLSTIKNCDIVYRIEDGKVNLEEDR